MLSNSQVHNITYQKHVNSYTCETTRSKTISYEKYHNIGKVPIQITGSHPTQPIAKYSTCIHDTCNSCQLSLQSLYYCH